MNEPKLIKHRHLIASILTGLLIPVGVLAILQMFQEPSGANTAWLFGFSPARILAGAGLLAVLVLLGLGLVFSYAQPAWWQKTSRRLEAYLQEKDHLLTMFALWVRLSIVMAFVPLGYVYLLPGIGNLSVFQLLSERFGVFMLWLALALIVLEAILHLYFSETLKKNPVLQSGRLAGWIFLLGYSVYQLYSYFMGWVSTPRKAYWHLLAQAFLDGKLYLVSPEQTYDLTLHLGRWYVPPPPLPALLMLPYVSLVGSGNVNTVLFSIFFAAANCMIVFLILDELRKRDWIKLGRGDLLWLVALFGLGTPHWWVGTLGMEWFVSQVVAVTFLALAILFVLKGWSPWLAGLGLGLAMASRPNLFVIWPLLLAIAVQIVRERGVGDQKWSWKWMLGWVVKSVLPVVMVVAGLLLYNYLRFGNPLDFGFMDINGATRIVENARKYGIYNLHFVPINLNVMLLKLPAFKASYPFMFPSLEGMSIFITSPALIYLIHRYEKKWWIAGAWVSVILSVVLLSLYHNTGAGQFGYKYVLDFIVPLIMLLAAALGRKSSWVFRVLVVLSMVINCYGVWWFIHHA